MGEFRVFFNRFIFSLSPLLTSSLTRAPSSRVLGFSHLHTNNTFALPNPKPKSHGQVPEGREGEARGAHQRQRDPYHYPRCYQKLHQLRYHSASGFSPSLFDLPFPVFYFDALIHYLFLLLFVSFLGGFAFACVFLVMAFLCLVYWVVFASDIDGIFTDFLLCVVFTGPGCSYCISCSGDNMSVCKLLFGFPGCCYGIHMDNVAVVGFSFDGLG